MNMWKDLKSNIMTVIHAFIMFGLMMVVIIFLLAGVVPAAELEIQLTIDGAAPASVVGYVSHETEDAPPSVPQEISIKDVQLKDDQGRYIVIIKATTEKTLETAIRALQVVSRVK